MDNDPLWRLAALALSLVGAAFVSSIETALAGVPKARVDNAVEQQVKGARRLRYWPAASMQILTTLHLIRLCLVMGVGFATLRLVDPLGWPFHEAVTATVVAVTVLVVSHLVPRALAKRYALEWSLATIGLVRVLTTLLSPLTWPLVGMTRALGRRVSESESWSGPFWTPDELGDLTETARVDALGKQNEDLLLSIFEFSDTIVREIMVPRTDMVALPVTCCREEMRRTVIKAGHSRIPVYEDTIDNIVGVLHIKDLFGGDPTLTRDGDGEGFDLKHLMRPTFYVPEVMKISEALREFQRRMTHMAIVVDEYGGTAGVVTLEDIIEEIVGEIQDEYDVEEKQFRMVGEHKVIADGRVNLWDLGQAMDVEFPDDGGYETLAGFLLSRAGHLLRPGAVITWRELRFTVKEANEKRIGTVEVERRKGGGAAGASG